MGRPTLRSLLIAVALVAAAIPLASRAQDVFSTTTGGSAPLQGGVSVTEPAAPGHTRPTGTQGVEGNPNCPPPTLADGTTPKNWSCTTRNQGVVGNPDCPAPVSADGTSPKNWSCATGTQGVEGNPNCPPPVIQGGMIPRNWSCAGPDMQPDPLSPLRDPDIAIDYRGDPGVPPLMRANAVTDEETAVAAVLTCRRAVVEGIERPSLADMAEYVCDDQGKALDLPPFQLRAEENVEQTVCILPLKGAVQELKAGKMLLLKAKDASGPERDWHMTKGNAHLLRASIGVDQSDLCLVENPPRPRAVRPPGAQRQQRPPIDLRAAMKNPCAPVAGLDPRLRGAIDAKCPRPAREQKPPPPPLQTQQPQTDDPDGGCVVAQAPLDVRDWLMDLAHRLDRNVDALQAPAMKGANRFFQGMNEVLLQQLLFLAQERGKPASQLADALVKHLTNDALENHNKLLADAQKAVEDFVNDPAYESGKTVSNYLIGRASGAATGAVVDRLPGGPKFCLAASRRATEESRKIRGAIEAAEELDKLAKQATEAADAPKVCRLPPHATAEHARLRAKVQKKQHDEDRLAAAKSARDKARPQRIQAAQRQAAAQAQRDKMLREGVAQRDQKTARQRGEQEKPQIAANQKAVDDQRAQQAQAIREQNRQVDALKRAAQARMKAEAPRRPSPPSPEEAAQLRRTQQAERLNAIEEAKRKNEMRRAAVGGDVPRPRSDPGDTVRIPREGGDTVRIPRESSDAPRQPQSDDYRAAAEQMRSEQRARADRRAAAGGDVPRSPSDAGDTVRIPREGGFGANPQQGDAGAAGLSPILQQATPINPFGQNQNCMPTSVAADLRKKHPNRPYTDSDIRLAGANEPTTSAEVNEILRKHYGREQFDNHTPARRRAQSLGVPAPMRSSAEIREELVGGAADSRGIVFVRDRRTGGGHVVNADREGGQVKYTDNQSGEDAAKWATAIDASPDLYDMFFFRTN